MCNNNDQMCLSAHVYTPQPPFHLLYQSSLYCTREFGNSCDLVLLFWIYGNLHSNVTYYPRQNLIRQAQRLVLIIYSLASNIKTDRLLHVTNKPKNKSHFIVAHSLHLMWPLHLKVQSSNIIVTIFAYFLHKPYHNLKLRN